MRSFFGVEGEPTEREAERAAEMKDLIAEGLLAARAGMREEEAAALVDDTYGSRAMATLKAAGVRIAVPVEGSGRRELAFEHEDWRERLERIGPDWAKVLVRFNPEGDPTVNDRQVERLAELAQYCESTMRPLMLELLVPPEPGQAGPDYDTQVRPGLVVRAIEAIREAQVTPSLWKIEGFERRADHEAVASVTGAPCVVLGRGQDADAVDRWLRAAAGVSAFAGFAIGRSIWWEPLRSYLEDPSPQSRRAAVDGIMGAYLRFTRVFTEARGAA
jgi:5-dehydro-2-deoxygluconokinase